jgi:ABC-2 type transport system permease protein
MVFLGRVNGSEVAYGLLAELFWLVVFIVLSRWLFRHGLRRYSAYGG